LAFPGRPGTARSFAAGTECDIPPFPDGSRVLLVAAVPVIRNVLGRPA